MNLSREQVLRAEISHVEKMLAETPDEFAIERAGLQSRIVNLESELAKIDASLNEARMDANKSSHSARKLARTDLAWPSLPSLDRYDSLETIGDAGLLSQHSTGVFCSSKCPGSGVLAATKWIANLADDETQTIAGGFHSAMEKSFLEILLGGRCRLIICPARSLVRYRMEDRFRQPMADQRLVIASSLPESVRSNSAASSLVRNRFAADLATRIVFTYAAQGSRTEQFGLELLGNGRTVHCLDTGCNTLLSAGAKLMSLES